MSVFSALCATAAALVSAGCTPAETPTQLPTPEGAVEIRQVTFLEGRAHQTDFTLKLKYPDSQAFDHYTKEIPKPWVRCDWMPNWQSHLDGTVTPVRTVHQQAHVWVNRDARRVLMVALRYYSPSDCAPQPLNDDQKVAVVEYVGVDVDEHVRQLQLTCPAKDVRSNSTPHSDAREAPRVASGCGARAGGRER